MVIICLAVWAQLFKDFWNKKLNLCLSPIRGLFFFVFFHTDLFTGLLFSDSQVVSCKIYSICLLYGFAGPADRPLSDGYYMLSSLGPVVESIVSFCCCFVVLRPR